MRAEEKLMLQKQQSESAYTAADALAYDEIIKPQNLRTRLITALNFQA